MKTLVTGGAGFIGSTLVEELLRIGYEVHVIDNLSTGRSENVHPNAHLHVLDIRSQEANQLIKQITPDYVFHLAAQVDVVKSIRDPLYDGSVNIMGTVNLLEACCAASVKKMIYASSCAVYGDFQKDIIEEDSPVEPISFYGISKLTPEHFLRVFHQMYGLNYTILRCSNVYGPRQTPHGEGGVVALFLEQLRKNAPLVIHGDGEQTRDFVYVKDVVQAMIAAVHNGDLQTIQIGTSTRTSINELIKMLQNIHPKKIRTSRVPIRPGDIKHSCLSHQKAKQHLHWTPRYSIQQGLNETYLSNFKTANEP